MVRVKFRNLTDPVLHPEAVSFTYERGVLGVYKGTGELQCVYPLKTVQLVTSYGPELYRLGIKPRYLQVESPDKGKQNFTEITP